MEQVRKTFRKSKLRDLAILAVRSGVRHRFTTNGMMFYGGDGYSFTIHATNSDKRAEKNATARFRKIGIDLKGKK